MAVHILPAGLPQDFDRRPAVFESSYAAGTLDREWSLLDCGRILYRRRLSLLSIAGLGIVAAALATAFQTPMYQSHAAIQIQGLNDNFLSLRDIYPTAAPTADNAVYIQTQAEILRQDALVEHLVQKFHLDELPEFQNGSGFWSPLRSSNGSTALEEVKKHIQILPARGSSIIQVVCEARDPKLAALLANTLAQTFIDQSIEARQRSARQTQVSLNLERDALRKRLLESEALLQTYSKADRDRTGYTALKREADANRQFYQVISQRIDEARIASAVDQSNARLVSPAQPPTRPYKPNVVLNLLLGAIGGLAIAVGFVMVREQTRCPWRTPAEAAASLGVVELGVIPNATSRSLFTLPFQSAEPRSVPIERASMDSSSSPLFEAFRAMAASVIPAANDGHHPRVLLFTSPYSGEGKTTVASNLAIILAEIGSKVLLIDANLRHPRLHKVFDQPNSWGLSDLLREKNAIEDLPLETLVKRTSVPRLQLLPGGTSSDNIFALLWSGRLPRLVPRFRTGFDYVLIDAPPCLDVSDARIIARHADTVVLVLRPDRSGRAAAQIALQRLQQDGTPVMGFVLNGWDPS